MKDVQPKRRRLRWVHFGRSECPGWVHFGRSFPRGIERFRQGLRPCYRLEAYDHDQQAPIIRVLYGTVPLAIFDGQAAAVIDPDADRDALWDAIVDKIQNGEFDEEIERVADGMLRSIREARGKKRSGPKAA